MFIFEKNEVKTLDMTKLKMELVLTYSNCRVGWPCNSGENFTSARFKIQVRWWGFDASLGSGLDLRNHVFWGA